jgi:large subunit ribosomal protein L21
MFSMDYAIIELGGKQYRVEKGDSVVVDRLDAAEGSKLSPKAVLFRSDKTTVIDGADLDKVRVEAVVAEHLKGPKVRVFKYRPKKRYRRSLGHRSLLTRLDIGDIKLGAASKAPAAKAPAESAADEKPRPAARKKPTEGTTAKRKPAPRKPAQRKTPAPKTAKEGD